MGLFQPHGRYRGRYGKTDLSMAFKTLDDIGDVHGKRVLVREDLNAPLDGAKVTDDTRLRAAVPTIAELAGAGAIVLILAHLGRPNGARDPSLSTALLTRPLSEVLGREVMFIDHYADPTAIRALGPGQIRAAGKYALQCPGGAKFAVSCCRSGAVCRSVRERCFFSSAPRACFDRAFGEDPAGFRWPTDAGRTQRPRKGIG